MPGLFEYLGFTNSASVAFSGYHGGMIGIATNLNSNKNLSNICYLDRPLESLKLISTALPVNLMMLMI